MYARIKAGEASALVIDTSSRLTRQGIRAALSIFFDLQDVGCRLFTTTGKEYAGDLGGLIGLIVDAEARRTLLRQPLAQHFDREACELLAGLLAAWPGAARLRVCPSGGQPEQEGTPAGRAGSLSRPGSVPHGGRGLRLPARRRPLLEQDARPRASTARFPRNSLLRNVAYIGKVRCDGEVYDGKHLPLVSEDRFERVQRRLDAAAVDNRRAPRKSPFAGHRPLRLLRQTLRYRLIKNGRYPYLVCTDNALTDRCRRRAIRAESFDASFALMLGSLAFALRTPPRRRPSLRRLRRQ